MVRLSDIQDPPRGPAVAPAAHTHAFPTPPPSPPLTSATSSSLASTQIYNDPPDLPLPPPLRVPHPRPASAQPPTLLHLATTLSTLPPETYTSRRRLLHLATTSGRAVRSAVVTWDDPAGGALVCLAWLAVWFAARPLVVLVPHVAAMGVMVANYPTTTETGKTDKQIASSPHAPTNPRRQPIAPVPLDADIPWSTTLADLSSVSRTLARARSLAATPVALASWTDAEASLATLWVLLGTFPVWIGLNLALPVHQAVGVAGLAPLCAGLVPKVLNALPRPVADTAVPGDWHLAPVQKTWLGFGVGVYVTRYRVYRLGQGYGALLETEEAAGQGRCNEWRAKDAIELPPAGDLGVRTGWLRRCAGEDEGVRRFVGGVKARVGEDCARLEVRWEWEEDEAQEDVWEPVGGWERVEVPGQGLVGRLMAKVEKRRYVRQAVCWVNVPVRPQQGQEGV